jgi:hypothetical protein
MAAAEGDLEAAVEEDLGAAVAACFFFLFLGTASRDRGLLTGWAEENSASCGSWLT